MRAFTNRYELKYLLDWPTYFRIKRELQVLFKKDPAAGKQGKYDVISLYYDTPSLAFFWDKIEGEEERVKVRLRTYDHHDQKGENKEKKQDVFLELKKKKNRNVYKKRLLLDNEMQTRIKAHSTHLQKLFAGKEFIKETKNSINKAEKELEQEILHLHHSRGELQPTLVVSYAREPLVSADNLNVRITFDSNVRYRSKDFSLATKHTDKHIIAPKHVIMEIKYTDYFPQWLVQLIQKYKCEARAISKYCIGVEHLLKEQR